MHRIIAALAALCLSLSALAGDFGWEPDLKEGARHPRHAGYVALHVVSNIDPAAGFDGWSGLRVRRTDTAGRRYSLQGSRSGISTGQVFAGALPAGDYALVSLRGSNAFHGITGSLAAPIDAEFARFQVRAGQFSDLGTLVLGIEFAADPPARNPFYRKFPLRQWRVASNPGLIRWLHAVHPWLARVRPAAQWPGSSGPKGLERAWLGSVATPRRLDDGTLLLPDRLGQLRVLGAGQSWRMIDTGFSVDLLDALRFDGRLLVAGDRGLIAAERPDGSFQALEGVAGDLVVHRLGLAAGSAFALGERPQEAQLLRLDQAQARWVVVARMGRREGFRPASGRLGPPSLLFSSPSRAVHSNRAFVLAQEADGLRLALGTRRWQYRHADGALVARGRGPALAGLFAQPNGVLVARPADDGAVEDALYSPDAGETWLLARRPSAPGNLSLALQRAPPYVDAQGAVFWVGPRLTRDQQLRIVATPESYLLKAREAGDRLGWEALRAMLPECSRLLGSLSRDAEWLVQCDDLRILRSTDRGAQWQTVWPSAPGPRPD